MGMPHANERIPRPANIHHYKNIQGLQSVSQPCKHCYVFLTKALVEVFFCMFWVHIQESIYCRHQKWPVAQNTATLWLLSQYKTKGIVMLRNMLMTNSFYCSYTPGAGAIFNYEVHPWGRWFWLLYIMVEILIKPISHKLESPKAYKQYKAKKHTFITVCVRV